MQTMKRIRIDYEDMIRMDNLLAADIVVRQGKKYTRDMRKWDANWQTNFQLLYDDLINETYTPLPCRESVRMTDGGKVRNIKEAMHRDKLSRLNKKASDPLYEDRYMASLNGILKHRDTDNLIKIWRIKYERVFKRHEQRAAVRAAFNEHKRRVKALEAELQYYGDVADRIRRREHESRNAV